MTCPRLKGCPNLTQISVDTLHTTNDIILINKGMSSFYRTVLHTITCPILESVQLNILYCILYKHAIELLLLLNVDTASLTSYIHVHCI